MKILIIGGKGYIGTALLDFLHTVTPDSYTITCVDTNTYSEKVKEYDDRRIKYIHAKYQDLPVSFYDEFTDIILLAGQGSVSNSKNLLTVIDNNIRNFAWLLNIIKPDQKFIYASSSSVYGKTDNKVVTENYNTYQPYNYYDWSKQTIDQLAELSGKQYYGLRFGTVNGFSRNLRNDVMINSMCYNAKINDSIFVYNGEVNRPILGIRDLCEAIWTIIKKGCPGLAGVYNLNSFNACVSKIATTVSDIYHVPCKHNHNQSIACEKSILNFKLQSNCYDFKIFSEKFVKAFDFEFTDSIYSIANQLLAKWNDIENFQNRLEDTTIAHTMISTCRVCDTPTYSLLDLGNQPLANNYQKSHDIHEEEYPLHLQLCHNCFHTQLNCVVAPEKLFKNYLYVSGTSKTLNNFFDEFATKVLKSSLENQPKSTLKVLEIACNDGSQLDAFLRLNSNIITVGVDPAENIYKEFSSKKKHDILCEFFSQKSVDKLKGKYGSFDVIIAQNVFAHIDYPREFLHFVSQLMDNNTKLYIQTSQKNMIIENQFDTVYHEHLSFFNTNSMKILCERNGLVLNNVDEHSIHGTSYIFNISKNYEVQSNTKEVLESECNKGLYSLDTYKQYRLKCLKYKNDFNSKILAYKLDNKDIIAFGSTAKSMTVFNFCGLKHDVIDFMIDENPLKHNLYTPGSGLQVVTIDSLENIRNDTVIIITAWNFYSEIKQKIINKIAEYNIKHQIILLDINTLCEEILI